MERTKGPSENFNDDMWTEEFEVAENECMEGGKEGE